MENKTPLQEAIRIIDSYLVKMPLDNDYQIGNERAYNEAIVVLKSLLPKEKEHGESIWTAAEKYTREDDRSIHGHEFENLSKVEFFNKLYPKK